MNQPRTFPPYFHRAASRRASCRRMRHCRRANLLAAATVGGVALMAGVVAPVSAQVAAVPKATPKAAEKSVPEKLDLTKQHVLFEIGYSHLDTEWCWNYPQVINTFVADTLHQNFALFEKYPDYTFNWTGANRYRFMKEYYPEDWVTLKKYVAEGRWFPNGSSLEEGDVNNPSPESIIRQVMYGNNYFRAQFGKAGTDFMLPDCFGFPASLPTILAHAGVKGFSTQKLTWGSAVGIPFNFGVWSGLDDEGVLAALNGGSYTSQVGDDRSQNAEFYNRVDADGKKSGIYADYIYYGKGDRGGSAGEGSAPWIEKSVHGTGPLKVVAGDADTLFNIVTPAQAVNLPHYKGDLELTGHSAGSLTSQAIMKHWNRSNEVLADAAEKASVGAMILGAQPYPMARITDAWWRFLPGQFHDLMAGTALPKSYEFAYNDQVIALNEFTGVIREGVGGIARGLDTRTPAGGASVVVYNALSATRTDVVEASVTLPVGAARNVVVHGSDGVAVPAQVIRQEGASTRIAFVAKVPSVGAAVFSVSAAPASAPHGELTAAADVIENARYRVRLNTDGDVSSVFDKKANQELLSAPMRLAFQYENPVQWPSWNMDWSDQQKPPRAYVDGPAKIEIVENGPARVALRVTRSAQGSTFAQTVRLSAGAAGDRVEFVDDIDWKSKESALKAVFPLAVSNPKATYSWGMGTIERDNNNEKRFEVGSHQWFDLTDTDGKYGVTVLSNDKNGSDKPDDNTLRLTLLYTPGIKGGYQHQGTQDWGRHHLVYGLEGHAGDWRAGGSQWEAARLNQPLMAFDAPSHPGALGKSFSLASVNSPQVRIDALKRAELSDEVVVRFNELSGKPVTGARLTMTAPILSAREINGQEQAITSEGAANVKNGALVFDMTGYHPRAFALKLGKAPVAALGAPTSLPIVLPFNTAATSSAIGKTDGKFDDAGRSIPGELLPRTLESAGVMFHLGATTPGAKNAVACTGQTLELPTGKVTAGSRLYVLAAAYGGDTPATFLVGGKAVTQTIQDWGGYIGQWDTREWGGVVPELTYDWHNPLVGLDPGYIKRDTVAWYSDHWRLPDGTNDAYKFCYLYRYTIDLPAGATSVTLPNNGRIRVFAATVARNPNEDTAIAMPLYETLADHRSNTAPTIVPASGTFSDATRVTVTPPLYYSASSDMHYTTDGSEPTAASPVVSGALMINRPVTLKVRQVSADGVLSPVASAQINVNDTTPPSIVKTSATGLTGVKVIFSEPLAKASAEDASHYTLAPAIPVTGATLGKDGRTVLLALGANLPQDGAISVTVKGVTDESPGANPVASVTQPIAPFQPVYAMSDLTTFEGGRRSGIKRNAPNLPTAGDAHWTINMFVYTEKTPDELTLLGGFGDGTDTSGAERFLTKYKDGISFWGSNVDIATGVPLDIAKWQMLTATYDGQTIRVYKNGVEIKNDTALLETAQAQVAVGTRGPWDEGHAFAGKVAGFTVWDQALSAEYLKTLLGPGG